MSNVNDMGDLADPLLEVSLTLPATAFTLWRFWHHVMWMPNSSNTAPRGYQVKYLLRTVINRLCFSSDCTTLDDPDW